MTAPVRPPGFHHHGVMRTRHVVAGAVVLLAATSGIVFARHDSADDAAPPSGPTIEVVQINLCGALGCYGEGVADRMEIVGFAVDALVRTRADIALLNEVCFDQLDTMVQGLAGAWPMAAVSVETLAADNGCAGHGYGNAVLHRGRRLGERTFGSCRTGDQPCLDNPPLELSAEQRAMVCATIRLAHVGQPVTACSVHLVPRGDQDVGGRTWAEWNGVQLESLAALIDRSFDGDGAVVVGGDFNAGPKRVRDAWPPGWTELDEESRPTRPVPEPRRKIDHVLLSPGLHADSARLLEVTTCPSSRLTDRWCTDHQPLSGTVTVD